MVAEYRTFRQAQASGTLLGGFMVGPEDEPEHTEHFIITTHRLPWSGINRQHYRLYAVKSEEDGKLRPADRIEWIGAIVWNLYGGRRKEAQISSAEIFNEDYRGRGLGRRLYVASINDLIDQQRIPISDVYRSEYAQRVWASLMEANPEEIEEVRREISFPEIGPEVLTRGRDELGDIRERRQYYEVTDYVQRRPDVHVRKHRRRA